MVVDVFHQGRANVPKKELKDEIARLFKVQDAETVVLFGFKTQFGGGKSTGFCLVYDNQLALKKFEPKYRLIRAGFLTAVTKSRKQRKERKNREKKVRGSKKHKAVVKKSD
jgi:small subunit ribosomal protein S24e